MHLKNLFRTRLTVRYSSQSTIRQYADSDYRSTIREKLLRSMLLTETMPKHRKKTIQSATMSQAQMPQVKDERSLMTPDEANTNQLGLSRIPKPDDKTIENSHDVYDIRMRLGSILYGNRPFEFANSNLYLLRTYL